MVSKSGLTREKTRCLGPTMRREGGWKPHLATQSPVSACTGAHGSCVFVDSVCSGTHAPSQATPGGTSLAGGTCPSWPLGGSAEKGSAGWDPKHKGGA